jgi:fermentation-respiration switch protein FrsA (DUF1100 family)
MRALLVLVTVAAALVGLVRYLEPRLAFFPARGEWATPADAGLAYEALDVSTADGETLRAWWLAVADPVATVVYFHGNGGNLSVWAPILAGLARQGYAVFAFDYRGYGRSSGRPSERGLQRDVDAVLAAFERRGPAVGPVLYWGRSLGVPMAAYAASRRRPDGLILESGFPDARAALGRGLLRILAVAASYRFDTIAHLRQVRAPVLVLHGDRDRIIPFVLGQQLYARILGPKQFYAVSGGDHNDVAAPDPDAYWTRIRQFVTSSAAPADR